MNLVFKISLIIHVIAGSIGLFTGTINMIRKKGDKTHKIVGKYFFLSMIINSLAGFLIAALHRNIFLLIIAIFSFYMTATGQRILSLKRIDKGQNAKPVDWILTILMSFLTLVFVILAFRLLIYNKDFGTVLIVFAAISGFMVKKDISIYQGNIKQKNYWLLIHLQRMIGAYIAALTAFLVVNNTYLPPVFAWLLPTVILTPLIFYWSKKYAGKKYTRRR